jgi:hypothetical protein
MRNTFQYRSSAITFLLICASIIFFTRCINNEKDKPGNKLAANYAMFAGSVSCIKCHKNIYDTHINTAHFHTSEAATDKSIKGDFNAGKNSYAYSTGGQINMEKRADGFYQVAYINGAEKKSERFDIVIGSGTKGQTFATWSSNKLFQLPITYFTSANQWCNSPGYPNKLAFDRPITSRCLECHATFAEKISEPGVEPELFDKNRMVLGVDCEKCHGPAAQHVEFQTQNPTEKKGKFIINPATFSRQQSLDMCALCHGGRLQKSKPSFSFTAGDKLSDYFTIDTTAKDADNIDVHGNQSGLLAASKCFKMSSTLTCITCHNTHENEKGKTALFSQRCLTCHDDKHPEIKFCTVKGVPIDSLKANCTSCHMPQQSSMAISVILQGEALPTPALMHTHYIRVYADETKKILAYFKSH